MNAIACDVIRIHPSFGEKELELEVAGHPLELHPFPGHRVFAW